MNVFELNRRLIHDYSSYIRSFIQIRDKRIHDYTEQCLNDGLLWPEPLIQLNPSFEPGEWVDELVNNGTLHQECKKIFRNNKDLDGIGQPLRLHRHQVDAIKAARSGKNYVLTTGTGSGKSLAYIIPIVNYILQHGSGRGIQAIVIYPMNALANSQYGELEKFLCYGYPEGQYPVTFEKYTGQESEEEKQRIIENPPDILLTNYVMLELILTRVKDKNLINAAKNLKFLVLDELHTYRGRQGADVAMLIRRLRNYCGGQNLQCVGTSATLAGTGTYNQQRTEVSAVASLLFGSRVDPEQVIMETLKRVTPDKELTDPRFVQELKERIQNPGTMFEDDYHQFINDPLSIWIETTFGITTEPESGRLIRSTPRCISGPEGAAKELSKLTGTGENSCIQVIQDKLLAGYKCKHPETGFPVFAFRLHQFISRGDTVYASLENERDRYITTEGQQFVPNDRNRILFPLAFCRECGQEYYSVNFITDKSTGLRIFTARDPYDNQSDEEENTSGFLFRNSANPWPVDDAEVINKVPDDWVEEHKGVRRIRSNRVKDLPRVTYIKPDGWEDKDGEQFFFIPVPFRFCLHCGVSYGTRQSNDFAKLSTLGSEGRSTATTILTLSAVRHLQQEETLEQKARKLLSFTDNRQDASLQAGHFNDFIEIGLLRSALYRAVYEAGPDGLRHDELTQKVFNTLNLPLELYAVDPNVRFQALADTQRALRNVLGYRLYLDLKRGWRITSPNLEQCGLLEIKYASLDEVCEAEDLWQECHPALVTADPETRKKVAKVLLDYMRRELAIKVDYLNREFQERIQQQSNQHLKLPWAIDENEKMQFATILYPRSRSRSKKDFRGNIYLSERSGFGQYLRRRTTFPQYKEKIGWDHTKEIIKQILNALRIGGLVEVVDERRDDVPGYQLTASSLIWVCGDGTRAFHDPIRVPNIPEEGSRTNPFFVEFYKTMAFETRGIEAREHTAQVPYELRIEREQKFREGTLPILYCSPTMELGVDISQLNVVNMRNIPPTPANYAQRSGRAGRSGQPALVFSYCSTGSSHDQYFFKRPQLMVAGAVSPPRLDIANEDLIQSHVQAIWLKEADLDLGTSLKDILDLDGTQPTLELLPSIKDRLNAQTPRQKALVRAHEILAGIKDDLITAGWYSDNWINDVLNRIPRTFESACDRWRDLYRAALGQREVQNRIIGDASRSAEDKRMAKRLRQEAESQLELLLQSDNIMQSDFYSYRYFASEGFLPGYNFPRLPLSAYIPGRRRVNNRDEFLSRARFLAIAEFGPQNFIYHEGSRYQINKVILPVSPTAEGELPTTEAKLCPACGYLHPLTGGAGPDLCQRCNNSLDAPLEKLFRLQNVSTKRRERINSDEEERLRRGYEIRTVVRFEERDGQATYRTASVEENGQKLAELSYCHTATLWRINLGWRRRRNKDQYGFVLDIERGYWAKNEMDLSDDDNQDSLSNHTTRVIPYVEDRKNCLILQPVERLEHNVMASLQAALKNAIQIHYQLEDNELAAEPLPNEDKRNYILFYEAAEGGAGVLRRLVDEPRDLAAVARQALQLCHFDPDTGNDMRRAPGAREDCEAACYNCLMSYGNQRDHSLLDRQLIKEYLLRLANAQVAGAPVALPRSAHLENLMRQAGSNLEREWLKFLEDNDCRLPSRSQVLIPQCNTRPDFIYDDKQAVIYIDGPPHDYPERRQRDRDQTECLEDMGYLVIRFNHQENWPELIARYPSIFGRIKNN
jgi:ATP-dependent helicase YprA (DUF1998 family)/very-short-patch-repair endonuclease